MGRATAVSALPKPHFFYPSHGVDWEVRGLRPATMVSDSRMRPVRTNDVIKLLSEAPCRRRPLTRKAMAAEEMKMPLPLTTSNIGPRAYVIHT